MAEVSGFLPACPASLDQGDRPVIVNSSSLSGDVHTWSLSIAIYIKNIQPMR